ncbi:unnamed protein product [Allacma fusca]|uniref:Uncharacterized protein n=1 Tax=Allacma fusca TaxID=39272 RepID=A0A8J2PFN8_9HEXA|nr:unnamed protein product [Allacma fusca]
MKRAGRMDRRKVAKQGGSKKFKPEDVAAEVPDKDAWYKTFKKLEVFRKYMETYDGEQDPQLFIEKVNKHRENLDIPLDLIVDNLDFYFRDSKDEEVRRWYSAKKVFVQYWIRQKVSYDEIWGNFSRSLCAYFSHDRHTEAKYSNLNSFEFMQGIRRGSARCD